MGRRRKSYGRRKIDDLRWAFLREHWRSVLTSFTFMAGMATFVSLLPFRQLPGWERGWAVGFLMASWLGMIGYLFMEQDQNAFRVYGVWAEEDWSREALKAAKSFWHVLHDIEFHKHNVDHVAIGPAGVLAIETKWVKTWTNDARCNGYLADTLDRARRIRLFCRSKGIEAKNAPVIPILIVWGPGSHGITEVQQINGVTVIPGSIAKKHLGTYRLGGLDPITGQRIHDGLVAYMVKHQANVSHAA